MSTSRRAVLLGGAAVLAGAVTGGYALVERSVLPGRLPLDRALGRCGDEPPPPAADAPPLERGTIPSRARGRDVGWVLARPPGTVQGAALPVCLVLHGRGSDAASAFDQLHWHQYLAAAVLAGTPPYVLVAADGGDGYWHPRVNGDDAQAMLLDELLPMLAAMGLRTDVLALAGWSMGGYGALLLAERLGPARVAGVATVSAAVWRSYGEVASGAFDSAADFAGHDVLAAAGRLGGIPLRIDCGTSDPFVEGNRALRAAVGSAAGEIGAGCHDAAYWERDAASRLHFLGQALAAR